MKRTISFGDLLVILLTGGIILFTSLQVYARPQEHLQVRIENGQESRWVYSLEESAVVSVPGPNGDMEVTLAGGHAFVEECSCCPLRICVSTGRISRPGQWIICLPNEIFIHIAGAPPAGTEVDDVVF